MNTENNIFLYDEVRVAKQVLAANQPNMELVIRGNDAFDKFAGFMLLVTDATGAIFTGNVSTSVATSQGDLLLPLQPYHCIRPSFQEKFEDRIIKIQNVKGAGQDFKFRIEAESNTPLTVNAVAYFTRLKNK
ncbi:MAG: hypothetical protein HGA42_00610 [Nostocales cyanobacterium W4_Combined_metabat2_030]|nr:hypothetical protein [Nostocales cyanobacterium W4_Combined_metabat2_030]